MTQCPGVPEMTGESSASYGAGYKPLFIGSLRISQGKTTCRRMRIGAKLGFLSPGRLMDGRPFNPAHALGRRDVLRALAACLADFWLPRRVFAQRAPRYKKPDRRVIVVTFGGGVRFEDTLAPQGWVNIPHLAGELVPKGLVYPVGRYEGLTGHFNSTAAMATGCRQDVDAYGGEAPLTPTIFELFRKEHSPPSRRNMGRRQQQELRSDGRQ